MLLRSSTISLLPLKILSNWIENFFLFLSLKVELHKLDSEVILYSVRNVLRWYFCVNDETIALDGRKIRAMIRL